VYLYDQISNKSRDKRNTNFNKLHSNKPVSQTSKNCHQKTDESIVKL